MNSNTPTVSYLGRHILAEFWGCQYIDDPIVIESAMINAAQVAGATVIGSNSHHFGEGMGVTCVVMLAESHISIHTWPEIQYAALDVFVCGAADPIAAINALKQAFIPSETLVTEHLRGKMPKALHSKAVRGEQSCDVT